ncbi:MAG: nucleotide exchange factor GrpE [Blastococcus sp.]
MAETEAIGPGVADQRQRPGDQPPAEAAQGAGGESTEGSSEPDPGVAALQARVAQLDDLYRRAVAEVANQRKRAARDMERLRAEERNRVAAQWLPVLDNLDRALEHAGADPAALVEGVRAVRDQALAVLEQLGFPRRDDLGATFDPARHEAVAQVRLADAPAGTVVQVVRPGYGDEDRQLRPASVVVAARPD